MAGIMLYRHWIVRTGAFLGLALLLLLGQAAPGRAFLGCGGETIPEVNAGFEAQLAALVNEARQEAGVPPLKLVSDLSQAARYHAADLGGDDYFEHDTYDRSSADLEWVCLWWQRVEAYYPGFDKLGENIAAGASTPEWAMELWMGSPGHRDNILSPDFREIGAGYAEADTPYQHYWVQDFSTGDSYPLVIEGEQPAVFEPEVQVYLYGSFEQMRLRVDEGEWSQWMDFQNAFTWELPAVRGDHTLYAEMLGGRLSVAAQDSVYLDYEAVTPYPAPLPTPDPQLEPFVPGFFIYLPLTIQ